MTFQTMFNQVVTNVGVPMEWLIILVLCLGTIIFAAKDFKLFVIVLFTITGGIFIWFYEIGLDYTIPLSLFFMSLVILVLSLFAVDKSSTTGGFI